MVFNNLKFFKTNYVFSGNELELYFNNALKSGCGKYMNELENQFIEKVHVTFSWTELFKYSSYLFLTFTIIGLLNHLFLPIILTMFGISLFFKVSNYILDRKIRKINASYELTKSFLQSDNYSFLEESRQDLLQ